MNQKQIAQSKLARLRQQLLAARETDYSYPSCVAAIDQLLGQLDEVAVHVKSLEKRQPDMQVALLRSVNIECINVTKLLGMIVRSTSTRTAFEFYSPFLGVCKTALGQDSKLIMSSEWEYSPLTIVQDLPYLPDFLFIGLPASESDNALIFPASGHELGHQIWFKEKNREKFALQVEDLVIEAMEISRVEIEKTYS